jgi:hypothetical protein
MHARRGAKCLIGIDHWRTAAIGEDEIVRRDALAEGIVRMLLHPIQRGRCVHIPEHYPGIWTL